MTVNEGRAIALVFAGGTGERMGSLSVPKQFLQVGGKPIIAHTLRIFQGHLGIKSIVVACLSGWIDELRNVCKEYDLHKVAAIVPGGDTGQQSIYNGLCAIEESGLAAPDGVVLVHDGVRPLVDARAISACIASVEKRGSTAVCAPAVETVVVQDGDRVVDIVDRSRCKLARAPQGFRFGELVSAHRRCLEEGAGEFIDSISLMANYGHEIFIVEGPPENIKITNQRDFFAFKGYMDMREMEQLWERGGQRR